MDWLFHPNSRRPPPSLRHRQSKPLIKRTVSSSLIGDRAIISGGGSEKPDRGALSKNNAKIWGLKLKLILSQEGHNFHFTSCAFALNCKNNSTCIVKQGMYSQCSMFLENVKFILKNVITF